MFLRADFGFGGIAAAVHHRYGNQKHQNAAAHLERARADAQNLQYPISAENKHRHDDEDGQRGDLGGAAALSGRVALRQFQKYRQRAKRIDQNNQR